jgi:hypothetical protein
MPLSLWLKVRLESIGAEDIVDCKETIVLSVWWNHNNDDFLLLLGNPRLILGLIWTIILRFQIQEIEIDVVSHKTIKIWYSWTSSDILSTFRMKRMRQVKRNQPKMLCYYGVNERRLVILVYTFKWVASAALISQILTKPFYLISDRISRHHGDQV